VKQRQNSQAPSTTHNPFGATTVFSVLTLTGLPS
jgi:hypothetical protein